MKFVSRSEWGARSPNGRTPAPDMTHGVGVHWLGPGSSRVDHGQCAAQMREVQAFHMGPERGWADFAYNAAVCRHGFVFEGRGPRIRNAANGGGTRAGMDANAAWGSVLYLEGTNGPGLTAEGQDAINDAAEWLGVAAGEWLGHRDFLSTECPGDRIYGWVHSGHPRPNLPTEPPNPEPVVEEDDMPRLIGVTNNRGIFLCGTTPLGTKVSKGRTPAVHLAPSEVEALVASKAAVRDHDAADLPEAVFDRLYVVVG